MKIKRDYLQSVGEDRTFVLKTGHESIITEVSDLEGLKNALEQAPIEAIAFHMDGRNDFAGWINEIIGCNTLSKAIQEIELNRENAEATRKQLTGSLSLVIDLLKDVRK